MQFFAKIVPNIKLAQSWKILDPPLITWTSVPWKQKMMDCRQMWMERLHTVKKSSKITKLNFALHLLICMLFILETLRWEDEVWTKNDFELNIHLFKNSSDVPFNGTSIEDEHTKDKPFYTLDLQKSLTKGSLMVMVGVEFSLCCWGVKDQTRGILEEEKEAYHFVLTYCLTPGFPRWQILSKSTRR